GCRADRAVDRQRQYRWRRRDAKGRPESEDRDNRSGADESRNWHGKVRRAACRIDEKTVRRTLLSSGSKIGYAKRRRLNALMSIADRSSTTHCASASPIAAECLKP